MSEVIRTERLLLRQPRLSDVDTFHAYRNDDEVSKYQGWPTPFLKERAAVVIGGGATLTDLGSGEWMMLIIANADDTEIFGDIFVEFTDAGRAGEVGYSLATAAWGNGYATEAVAAVATWLFAREGFVRASGKLHPDNYRSARVLENCGFVFEGHTRNSNFENGEVFDDWVYGLTPEQHGEWLDRPRHRPEQIELVDLSPETLRTVISLTGHHSQDRFVSPISASLASFAVPPFEEDDEEHPTDVLVVPWARVVEADGEPVGFVMVAEPTSAVPEAYLWRLLIDRMHQRRGIGRAVVEQVIEIARTWDTDALLVSWVPGVGSPEPLYRSLGFEPTGKIHDGEIEARLAL